MLAVTMIPIRPDRDIFVIPLLTECFPLALSAILRGRRMLRRSGSTILAAVRDSPPLLANMGRYFRGALADDDLTCGDACPLAAIAIGPFGRSHEVMLRLR